MIVQLILIELTSSRITLSRIWWAFGNGSKDSVYHLGKYLELRRVGMCDSDIHFFSLLEGLDLQFLGGQ